MEPSPAPRNATPRGPEEVVTAFLLLHFLTFAGVNLALAVATLTCLASPGVRRRFFLPWPGATRAAILAFVAWMFVSRCLSPESWVEGVRLDRNIGWKPALAMVLGYLAAGPGASGARRIALRVAAGAALLILPVLPTFDGYRISMGTSVYGREILGPNVLGGALAYLALITLSLGLATPTGARTQRLALAGLLVLQTVLTGSRTSWVLLVTGAATLLALRLSGRSLVLGLAGLAMAAATALVLQPRYLLMADASTSLAFRKQVWAKGAHLIARAPVFGAGSRHLGNLADQLWPPYMGVPMGWTETVLIGNPSEFHNDYLSLGAQYGIPGTLLFVTLHGVLLATLARAARSREPDRPAGGGPRQGPGQGSGALDDPDDPDGPEVTGLLRGHAAAITGLMVYALANPTWMNKELGPFTACLMGTGLGAAAARLRRPGAEPATGPEDAAPPLPCKLCDQGSAPLRYRLRDGSHLHVCDRCGAHFLSHRDDLSALPARLAAGELTDADRAYLEHEQHGNRARFDQKVELLAAHLDLEGARCLDLGAGGGLFMHLLAGRGARVEGIEPNRVSAAFAAERFGLDLDPRLLGDPHWQDTARGAFDAVTLWDVIEHVNEPRTLLAEAGAVLRPGGLLLLDTPMRDGTYHRLGEFGYRLSGGAVPGFLDLLYSSQPLGHKQILSRSDLTRLLDRAGFDLLELRTQHELTYPVANYLRAFFRSEHLAAWLEAPATLLLRLLPVRNKMVAVARKRDRPASP